MGWRNEETKTVKVALEIAGIKASVRHGIGTAGSWIEITTQGSFGKHWKVREGDGTIKEITQAEAETLSYYMVCAGNCPACQKKKEQYRKIQKIVWDTTGKEKMNIEIQEI